MCLPKPSIISDIGQFAYPLKRITYLHGFAHPRLRTANLKGFCLIKKIIFFFRFWLTSRSALPPWSGSVTSTSTRWRAWSRWSKCWRRSATSTQPTSRRWTRTGTGWPPPEEITRDSKDKFVFVWFVFVFKGNGMLNLPLSSLV